MRQLLFLLAIFGVLAAPASAADDLYDDLKTAPNAMVAGQIASDIRAQWLESGSPTVDLLMERGIRAQIQGNRDFAREMYDRVILIEPDYPEVWNRRAQLFVEDEKFGEALQDLNEALSLEPRHFGAWTGIGYILSSLGAEREALEAYRQALDINPWLEEAKQAERRLGPIYDGKAL